MYSLTFMSATRGCTYQTRYPITISISAPPLCAWFEYFRCSSWPFFFWPRCPIESLSAFIFHYIQISAGVFPRNKIEPVGVCVWVWLCVLCRHRCGVITIKPNYQKWLMIINTTRKIYITMGYARSTRFTIKALCDACRINKYTCIVSTTTTHRTWTVRLTIYALCALAHMIKVSNIIAVI